MTILPQSNKKVQHKTSFLAKKCKKSELTWHFYDFEVAEVSVVHREANEGANLVPSLQSCSSWIDVKQLQPLIILHFQDVAVA